MQPLFQKVVESARLISLPDIYFRLKELIEAPDFSMAEVALHVGRDPGMAARFLQVVNSPLNRRARTIDSVVQAVSLLGISQVHDIVLSVSVARAFEGLENDVMDMKKFWSHSVFCAVLTRELALESDQAESDRFIVMGLLHDLGHLFMYLAIPKESQEVIMAANQQQKPLHLVERDMLGFDYAQVGGYVLKEWNLPENLQATTLFHPEPSKAGQFKLETSLLHISSLLVQAQERGENFGQGAFVPEPGALELTGLEEHQCSAAIDRASEEFASVVESIFSF